LADPVPQSGRFRRPYHLSRRISEGLVDRGRSNAANAVTWPRSWPPARPVPRRLPIRRQPGRLPGPSPPPVQTPTDPLGGLRLRLARRSPTRRLERVAKRRAGNAAWSGRVIGGEGLRVGTEIPTYPSADPRLNSVRSGTHGEPRSTILSVKASARPMIRVIRSSKASSRQSFSNLCARSASP
jgi:hypothetical protein